MGCDKYSRTPVTQTLKGNKKQFELVGNSSYPSLRYKVSTLGGIGVTVKAGQAYLLSSINELII